MSYQRLLVIVTRRFYDGSGGTHSATGTRTEMGAWLADQLPASLLHNERFTMSVEVHPAPTELGGEAA